MRSVGDKMSKKKVILQEIKARPFQSVKELAKIADTSEEYVRNVIRSNEVNMRVERTAKYLEEKKKYAELAKRYTDALIKIDKLETEDRLAELFNLQKKMQKRINNDDLPAMKPERIPMTVTSIVAEVGEILEDQQRWKDWKQDFKDVDYNNLAMEVADLWHFVINLTLFLNMDADDLYEEFVDKNKVNHWRQDNGY